MKKYSRHWIYFWVTFLFVLLTTTSIGKWNQFLTYLIITSVIAIINFLLYKTSDITIDNKIINGKTGIIHTEKLSSNKSNITSVKIDQSILGRILNYGTINISTASSNYIFRMMKNPSEIQKEILK